MRLSFGHYLEDRTIIISSCNLQYKFLLIVNDAANTPGGHKNNMRRKSAFDVRFSVISRFGHSMLVAAKRAQCLNDVHFPLISQCTYVPTL